MGSRGSLLGCRVSPVRYAARHPDRTTAVAYIAGVGAGNAYKEGHARRTAPPSSGPTANAGPRWPPSPAAELTPAEEREMCLLQWRTDFSPVADAAGLALALWATRPPGVPRLTTPPTGNCGTTV